MLDLLEKQQKLTINQWKIAGAATLGDMLDFFDFFLIGFVLAFIVKDWGLTYGQSGAILLASGVSAPFGSLFYGWLADRISRRRTKIISGTVYVIGAIACLPFAGQLIPELAAAPVSSILGMVYLGAVPTALAFSTWAYALSRMPAGQLGVTTYVVPTIVVIFGFIFFGEIPGLLAIIGGVLALVGVAISRRRSVARRGCRAEARRSGDGRRAS